MSNEFDNDEPFSDMPEEAQTGADGKPLARSQYVTQTIPSVQRQVTKQIPVEPQHEEEIEEEASEEDFSDVLTDAHLRLEQGSLYKLIMNNNLFEEVDADPKAIQNVQREIRNFARERMEVMLGMRKETTQVEHLEIDFPFNALEVDVLKKLAHTATKGATERSDRFVPEVTRVTEELDNVGQPPKRNTLSPIRGGSKTSAPKKKLQNKPTAPVKRSKLDVTIEQIAAEEGVPIELLEINTPGVGGNAPASLEERARLAARRGGAQVQSPQAIPAPTFEQHMAKASQQVSSFGSTPLGQRILDAVKSMPIKNS